MLWKKPDSRRNKPRTTTASLAIAALTLAGLAGACSSDRDDGRKQEAAPQEVSCEVEFDDAHHEEFSELGIGILTAIKSGAADPRIEDYVSVMTAIQPPDVTRGNIDAIRRQIGEIETARLVRNNLVEAPLDQSLVNATCGPVEEDDPAYRLVTLQDAPERTLILEFEIDAVPFAGRFTMLFYDVSDEWGLRGLWVNQASFNGRTATDYERAADEYVARGELLTAYLCYTMAGTTSLSAPFIADGITTRVARKLEELQQSVDFLAASQPWDLGERAGPIYTIGIHMVPDALLVHVVRMGDVAAGEEAITADCQAAGDALATRHPELGNQFNGVLCSTFGGPPTDPQFQSTAVHQFVRP